MYQVNLYSHVSYDPFYIYQGSYQVLNDQKKENGNLLAKFKDFEMSKDVYNEEKGKSSEVCLFWAEKSFVAGQCLYKIVEFHLNYPDPWCFICQGVFQCIFLCRADNLTSS